MASMASELTRTAERMLAYVTEGLLPDTFVARESIGLIYTLAVSGAGPATQTYEPFFQAVDVAMAERFVLAVCRLYDPPSARNEVRSIPAVLALLGEAKADLPILNRRALEIRLRHAGVDADLTSLTEADLWDHTYDHFSRRCPSAKATTSEALSRALEALKMRRDKRIAHSEHTPDLLFPSVTWEVAQELVSFAEGFLSCYACGFLQYMVSMEDGAFLTSESDAVRARSALRRLVGNLRPAAPVGSAT